MANDQQSKPMSEEEFQAMVRPFVEAGLLTEIGHNKHINVTVYNMADTVYLLMPHREMKGAAYGVSCTYKIAEGTLMNDRTFVRYITSLGDELLFANTVMISEASFEAVRKYKEKTDREGPTKSISRKFETKMRKLKAKYGYGPYSFFARHFSTL